MNSVIIVKVLFAAFTVTLELVHCFPAPGIGGNGVAMVNGGGSRCPGVTCVPPPAGATCEAKYGVQDRCCPRWVCTNGQTAYGSFASNSNSWSSNDANGYSSSSGFQVSQGQQQTTAGRNSYPSSSSSWGYSTGYGAGAPGNFGQMFGQGGNNNFPQASGSFPGFLNNPLQPLAIPDVPLW